MRSDGGGIKQAARKPLVGADRVSRALARLARTYGDRSEISFVDVNGQPGLRVANREEDDMSVIAFTVDDGLITTIHPQRNPEKLRHVR